MENMSDKQVNDETKKTIDEEMQRSYHNVIRQMIKDENEIRNQRTNWFLVIQGFLIAGFCELYANKCLKEIFILLIMISIIGFITSCSFLYAAWRSEKAIKMLLAVWDIFIGEADKRYKDYPPVIALTSGIINKYKDDKNKKFTDNDKRELEIYYLMYYKKTNIKRKWDSFLNKLDFLLPFMSIPVVFIIAWIAVIFIVFIVLKDLPCK